MKRKASPTATPNRVVDQLAALSPEKRRLLELRLAQRRARQPEGLSIPRRTTQEQLPLSFAQERLWFLDQFEPNSALYNICTVVRLQGTFHLDAFRQAIAALVARHETLRTTFPVVDGTPHQAIATEQAIDVTTVDLRSWTDTDCDAEAIRLVTEDSQRPFDLANGPLIRPLVVQIRPEEHLLSLTVHHIISDGWSSSVLWRELAVLYDAFISGQAAPLPPLSIQYADFAIWQRQQLQGEAFAHHLKYWKEHLAGAPPLLTLPTDRPRPSLQTYHGASQVFTVPPSLTQALKALSQRAGATLFMTLLAAFQVLLARYTGQEDIVIGSPTAGRSHVELEGLIGFFVNTLVFRTDLANNPTFRELLLRVRDSVLQSYAHQEVPYQKLVDELQLERNLSHAPLVQVLFALHNVPPATFKVANAHSTKVAIESSIAMFDLSLAVWDEAQGLRCEIEYNTDLFDRATIARLIGHYRTLLEGVVANPDQPIATLPLLTAAERQQLVVDWNAPTRDSSHAQCVHRLIEAQVEQTPETIAVMYEGQQLTYRELNARANYLAQQLQGLGAGPNVLVGLCLARSVEVVIGILGILKSGAAFVPLDPDIPPERLGFTVEDAQLGLVVTQEHLQPLFSSASRCQVVCLDPTESRVGQLEENVASVVTPDDLAYVIYTSGSTGTPKGTLIEHQAIARHCADIQAYYQLTAADRVLQFSSLSFDTALEQILPPLISGAAVILRDAVLWAADDVLLRLSELGVTVVDFPTAYWRQLLHLLQGVTYSGTLPRLVIVGGEAMVPEDLALWQATPLRTARLLNAYGPTEATITSTICELAPLLTAAQLPLHVPIGRPLGNRRAFILDHSSNPVPIGVPGELYLGGDGLARGYLQRPELTAERFITCAVGGGPPQRLYRTGDLARYLPDGNIEFLGRTDQQVKIRGFRVELEEIGSVLCQHPAVQDAVVLVQEEHAGTGTTGADIDKRLVAYVDVGSRDTEISELRHFLKQKLPEFMIPSALVCLDALPLMANGKVDRKALPVPDQTSNTRGENYVGPRGPVEEAIARIWSEALKVKQVGVHDNFFEIGGHSLLIIQVHRRLCATLGREVSVVDLFRHPTISSLAGLLSEDTDEQVQVENIEQRAQRRKETLARRKRFADY
jgi:amino acid adenylation domain-containing protein